MLCPPPWAFLVHHLVWDTHVVSSSLGCCVRLPGLISFWSLSPILSSWWSGWCPPSWAYLPACLQTCAFWARLPSCLLSGLGCCVRLLGLVSLCRNEKKYADSMCDFCHCLGLRWCNLTGSTEDLGEIKDANPQPEGRVCPCEFSVLPQPPPKQRSTI